MDRIIKPLTALFQGLPSTDFWALHIWSKSTRTRLMEWAPHQTHLPALDTHQVSNQHGQSCRLGAGWAGSTAAPRRSCQDSPTCSPLCPARTPSKRLSLTAQTCTCLHFHCNIPISSLNSCIKSKGSYPKLVLASVQIALPTFNWYIFVKSKPLAKKLMYII